MQSASDFRHYRLSNAEPLREPSLFFRLRIDLRDVRSGISASVEDRLTAFRLPEADLDWVPDMVYRVDSGTLVEIEPPRQLVWDSAADEQMRRFLQRYYYIRLWKNSRLGLYSRLGESRESFAQRALESLAGERREVVSRLREVFLHRFLALERRATRTVLEDASWDSADREQRLTELRHLSARLQEELSVALLNLEKSPNQSFQFSDPVASDVELQERLSSLASDLRAQVNELLARQRQLVEDIEIYEAPVPPHAVEIVERGFLWSSPAGLADLASFR